ncbi:response regulator [Brevibacillus humidisoli]|uniref:hybrid sensor histidine kinase/response regulator n=1 Tax=Brevibacillus humidisoli TaxID=2895522 RepID=UPI001E52A391|nr:ATP-binding protein [Brevibacillus humidisoli]UFJ41043.1 response regulator [Brevibacillus humidisoli]
MNNKRVVLLSITVVTLLFLFVVVNALLDTTGSHTARQGVLDLRDWDWQERGTVTVRGEWRFYPQQLIDLSPEKVTESSVFIQLPGTWSEQDPAGRQLPPFGYGTYRLQILLDEELSGQTFAIYVPSVSAAHKLFVNGKLAGESGVPAASTDLYQARMVPYVAYQEIAGTQVELLIQTANYDRSFGGGMNRPIVFGVPAEVNKEHTYSLVLEMTTIIMLLLFALYFLLVYIYQSARNDWRYVIFFCLSAALYISIRGERWLYWLWSGIPDALAVKLLMLSGTGVGLFMLLFICRRYRPYTHPRVLQVLLWAVCGLGITYVIGSVPLITNILWLSVALQVAMTLYTLCVLLRAALNSGKETIYEFVMILCFVAAGLTDILNIWGIQEPNHLWSLQILTFAVVMSLMIVYRFVQTLYRLETSSGELLRMDRMRDEFLAHTSYELRTPLHAVINVAQSLLESKHKQPIVQQTEDIKLIVTVVRQLVRRLDDLLDWSQLRAGTVTIQPHVVHLPSLVSSLLDVLRHVVPKTEVQLVNQVPSDLPPVVADEQRLTQILSNLLHNALKHTKQGTITVSAQSSGSMLEIRVSDTGSGIPHGKQEGLFDAYEQAVPSTLFPYGTGMGLSITKKLVELQGGTIRVSSSLGQGATFTFTLPIAGADHRQLLPSMAAEELAAVITDQAECLAPTAFGSRDDKGDANILIVDDDPINLMVLRNLLELDHHQVAIVSTANEALEELHRLGGWELVILDLTMPEMSGFEICRRIREQYSLFELPVLMLTADGQTDDALAAFAAGANDLLTKPVESAELRARVRTMLQMKRSVADKIRMELAFLQAQIRPHFLFNTLNSIAALSEEDPDQMRELLTEFGRYLRESFRFENLQPFVPLERELQLVRSYLHIEQIRYEDRLRVQFDLPDNLRYRIPPLTIQPIVENAVRHGIMKRPEGGEIHIQVKEEEDSLVITVRDNGVGIPPDKMVALMKDEPTGGIGLKNINRRMKQLFGHGMSIHSTPTVGTTISIRLPKAEVAGDESDTGR